MNIKITEEVSLEDLSMKDAEAIFSLIEENRELLEQYLYWAEAVTDIETTEGYIFERIDSGRPGAKWFKIVFQRRTVGVFGIKAICYEHLEAEIGYWLSQAAQGHGIISQAVASIGRVLKNQEIEKLKITCLDENKASIAVAKRAGATQTDTIHQYMQMGGKLQNLNIYTVQL